MGSGQAISRWARALAAEQGLPLATVLAWPDALLMEEAARLLVRRGEEDAQILFQDKRDPDLSDTSLRGQVTRAAYARLVAADRAAKAKANDDAFAAYVEQGAFQQG